MADFNDIGAMRKKFFDARRGDVERNSIGQAQQADDAINRKFTSMGMGGSGAAIGAGLKAREGVEVAKHTALNDLAGQENTADLSQGLADRDFGLKKDIFEQEKANKIKDYDLANKQFDLDSASTRFNMGIANKELNRQQPSLTKAGAAFLANPFDPSGAVQAGGK